VLGLIYASLARVDDPGGQLDAESAAYAAKSIRHLEAARRGNPDDPGMEMALGRLYLATGKAAEAIPVLRRLAEADPDRSEPTALLADAYEQAGRTDAAVSLLESVVARRPQFYAPLAALYVKQGRLEDAVAAYQRAVGRSPQDPDLKTRLAVTLLSGGRSADVGRAVTLLQDARRQSPGDTHVLYLLGQAQRMAGQLDEAETTARQLIAIAPRQSSGAYALAQVLEQKQSYQEIVDLLEPVVSSPEATGKPGAGDLTPLLVSLGFAYQELGQHDRAIGAFDRAQAASPADESIEVYRIATLVAARRYREALERASAAAAARPGDQRLVRLRAEALRCAGKEDEAIRSLEDALTAHRDDVSAHLALSELQAGVKRYDAAARVLEQAMARFPADLSLPFQLGSVFERQGRIPEAERRFKDVIAKDPLHAPALNYLGYMLADRGERLGEAIGYIERAVRIEPWNGAFLDSLGWAYYKQGRLDLAEPALRKAAARRPRDSAVQDHFGDLLFRLERYQEAMSAWRKALDGDGEQIDRDAVGRKIRSATEKVARQ